MNQCGLCETPLQDGYLCPGDTLGVVERLDRMPLLYTALAAFLHPGGRRPELGRSTRVHAPLPIVEPVLNLRGPGGIVGILEDWRSAMQADRGWGQPAVRGDTEQRIRRAARGLSMNLDWIAASWPMAGPFAEELRDLERSVLSIVSPPESSLRLGNCPAVFEDGVICGAVLRVPHGTVKVECRWCNTVYPPESWLSLAANQWGDQAAEERQAS